MLTARACFCRVEPRNRFYDEGEDDEATTAASLLRRQLPQQQLPPSRARLAPLVPARPAGLGHQRVTSAASLSSQGASVGEASRGTKEFGKARARAKGREGHLDDAPQRHLAQVGAALLKGQRIRARRREVRESECARGQVHDALDVRARTSSASRGAKRTKASTASAAALRRSHTAALRVPSFVRNLTKSALEESHGGSAMITRP